MTSLLDVNEYIYILDNDKQNARYIYRNSAKWQQQSQSQYNIAIPHIELILQIAISKECYQSMPCSHEIVITYKDIIVTYESINGFAIYHLLRECGFSDEEIEGKSPEFLNIHTERAQKLIKLSIESQKLNTLQQFCIWRIYNFICQLIC